MSIFSSAKDYSIERKHNWVNGLNVTEVEQPNYEKMFLSTEREIQQRTTSYMKSYHKALDEFKSKTSLTALDMGILMFGAMLQTLRWAILSNDKMRFSNANDADKLLDKGKNTIIKSEYVPTSIQDIIASVVTHTVPYDATTRSERFQSIYPEFSTGLSGTTHRYRALGHDPIAGLIVGTANIVTNTVTVNNFSELFPSYHVVNHQINAKTSLPKIIKWTGEKLSDNPKIVGAAFIRQIIHCGTDVFTKQGLPIPLINVISPETSQFLIGKQIDTYSVARSAMLAVLINKFVEMLHRLFFNQNQDDKRLYEVRTRKILMYSNTLASVLNLGYVGLTKNVKKIDIGGLLVTLWRILNDKKIIDEIQREFINKTLSNELQKEQDEVNQQLALWGFSI